MKLQCLSCRENTTEDLGWTGKCDTGSFSICSRLIRLETEVRIGSLLSIAVSVEKISQFAIKQQQQFIKRKNEHLSFLCWSQGSKEAAAEARGCACGWAETGGTVGGFLLWELSVLPNHLALPFYCFNELLPSISVLHW